MSYLGDAEIGEGANIGAGTITANYDGKRKHRTTIGDGAFIGVDTMIVAPGRDRRGRQDRRRRRRHPGRAARQARGRRPRPDPRAARRSPADGARSGPTRRADGRCRITRTPRHRLPDVARRRSSWPPRSRSSRCAAAASTSSSTRATAAPRRVRRLLDEPGRFLAVSQLGLTFIGFFAVGVRGGQPRRRPRERSSAAPAWSRARGRRSRCSWSRSSWPCSRSCSPSSCPRRSRSPTPSGIALVLVAPDRASWRACSGRSSRS